MARVRSSELLAKLQLEDLNLIFRFRRLRWFGHVGRSSGAIRTAYDMQIDGKGGGGGREAHANLDETDRDRVATVREKVLENEKFSRSGKSQGITFSVREI